MNKIISLFRRDYVGDHLVYDEIVAGAEWVVVGEGVATQKFDGTCCLVRHGRLFRRHDAKGGRTPPVDFVPVQDPDPVTGHWPGWVPVGDGPGDRWHREALEARVDTFADGTYELCGPRIGGNPEQFGTHRLVRHGIIELPDCPRTFGALRAYLGVHDIEGIVWHHPDGRMVKIKGRDFGIQRPR